MRTTVRLLQSWADKGFDFASAGGDFWTAKYGKITQGFLFIMKSETKKD